MTDPIYKKEVLRLAADAVGAGRLAGASGTGTAHNPSCGDKVTVDLTVAAGQIVAIGHDAKACVLTQASASILGASLPGKTENEVRILLDTVRTMLAEGPSPSPPFDAYGVFDGVTGHKNRHRCVTLPIEAALSALENSKANQGSSEGA